MVEREISLGKLKKFMGSPDTAKFITTIKKYGFLVLLIIPIILAIYLRVLPLSLSQTDAWAYNSISTSIRNDLTNQVMSEYPNLPRENVMRIVEERFAGVVKENKAQIETQQKQISAYFKSQFQDPYSTMYMLDLDSYFWSRFAKNVADHGHPGDYYKEVDGKLLKWDALMLAPLGRAMPDDMFHAYFEGYMYKLVKVFNRNVVPEHIFNYFPAIMVGLAVIPAFFIARKFGGNIAGFFSGTVIAILPLVLSRTNSSDTDSYNITFPLYIFWFFVLSFEASSWKKKVMYGVITGLLMGVYSIAWGGWWYILMMMVISCFCYILYFMMVNTKKMQLFKMLISTEIRNIIFEIGIIMVSSLIFVSLIRSPGAIFGLFGGIFYVIKLHSFNEVWPNVFTTVAEQNEGSFSGAISQFGGMLFFSIALIGILTAIILSKLKGKTDIKYAVFLALWLILPMWAASRGVRFVILAGPAFAISFGLAMALVVYLFDALFSKIDIKPFSKGIPAAVLIVGTIILFTPNGMWNQSKTISYQSIPMMNDAWYNSLAKINKEAAPNSIINSWWDYGHWFKAIGNRSVTFDGTSQYTPMAFWIGKVLLTGDEEEAVSILRSLDCGKWDLAEVLEKEDYDTAQSVSIIRQVIPINITDDEARNIMESQGVPKEAQEELIKLARCKNPPENYFITSEDMISKGGVWGHFGSWNFEKAQMYVDMESQYPDNPPGGIAHLKERFGINDENIYYELRSMSDKEAASWVAPWPQYLSAYTDCESNVNATLIQCNQDIKVNLENMTISVGENDTPKISAISYGGKIYKQAYESTQNFGLFYSYNKNKVTISTPDLADSMFNRLHFDEGNTTKYFELFSYQKSISGENIYVWKVKWPE